MGGETTSGRREARILLIIPLPFPVQLEAIVLLEAETKILELMPLDCKESKKKKKKVFYKL